jgi:hypothetical protein
MNDTPVFVLSLGIRVYLFAQKYWMGHAPPLAGTPYVEMPAVMAKYNPFAEKAGMKKIAEQPPQKNP